MVSRITRKQIIQTLIGFGIAGILIVLGTVYLLEKNPDCTIRSDDHVYPASAHDLDLAVLDGIVAADNDKNKGADITDFGAIKASIVPHHLVASKSIALGIKALASQPVKTIVLISPDHFFGCSTMLCTTEGKFTTFFGDVNIDNMIVDDLKRSDLVSESDLFKKEHGIFTILPFIKKYLPEANIVPIVISQKSRGSEESRAEVLRLLEPILAKEDTALVVSSDFSHYLSLTETRKKDTLTQASFCSGNSDEILNLQNPSQSDCPLCLWILEQEAEKLGFWNPIMLAHTNSAELLNDETARGITSHFAFAFSKESAPRGCDIINP